MFQDQALAKRKPFFSFPVVMKRLRDPLLITTYTATVVGMTGMILLTVIAAGTSLLVWTIRSQVTAAMAGIKYIDATQMPFSISMNLLLVAVMAVVGFLFLGQLRQLLESVANGDAFGSANARRLTLMGWLTIAVNVLAMNVGSFGTWFAVLTHAQNPGSVVNPQSLGFNPTGWLLALVLFILARVFKQGTSMQQDLEGTV